MREKDEREFEFPVTFMSRAGLCGLNFFCKRLKTPIFNICLVLKKNPVRDALKRNHSLYILCKIAMQQFGYKFR